MAASYSCSSSSLKCSSFCSISPKYPPSYTLLFLLLLLSFSLISISLLLLSIFKRLKKADDEEDPRSQTSMSSLKHILSKISNATQNTQQSNSTQSILLEFLPSNPPKWGALFSSVDSGFHSGHSDETEIEDKKKKRKKKKGKKKQLNCHSDLQLENGSGSRKNAELGLTNKEELVCLYPFTSSSSATQRKIKQQYDQLVKSHESKGLTLAQVGEFVNCLVDARNEVQQKSECIKRKFTITKALLLKADRSSFDRLRQQIYKLELEQKRLEEDAFVYNWLQHQLKLSPAYKKMVEIGDCMELKAKSGELTESPDTEQNNISFEEFLAQEKKDTFW
ncbi:tRNA(Ile)-lysidine synthase [Bienertia sinuspersici]